MREAQDTAPQRQCRVRHPLKVAILVVVGGLVFILGDDILALLERATSAPWTFRSSQNQPVGTWEGAFQGRTITLRLELAVWGDGEVRGGRGRNTQRANGFFFEQLELLPHSAAFVRGTLTVAGRGGATDRFETEGEMNLSGTHALLNVHGADGTTGLMIEKADVMFTPPQAEAALRYRVPGSSGYVTAGVVWSAVPQPGVVALQRK